MQIIIELLIATALIVAMAALWRESRRRFFTPVKPPHGCVIYTVISVSGDGNGLEQLIGGLLWLHSSTGLVPRIVIEDCGLDADGIAVAHLLERDNKAVVIAKDGSAQHTAPRM